MIDMIVRALPEPALKSDAAVDVVEDDVPALDGDDDPPPLR